MKKTIFLFFAAILCAMTANAQWALMGTLTDWSSGKAMTVSGSTATCTVDLPGKTTYTLKVKNGSTWYGRNSTTISATTTTSAFSTSGGDVTLNTDIPGTYTFSFYTSTKELTVTYPTAPAPHDITVRAKVPASWTNTITAWVWTSENGAGEEVTPTKDGDYYKITKNAGALYVIFKNGAGWNGDKNQTVDLCYTEDVCLQLNQSGTAKATATVIDCGAVYKDITVKAVVPGAWENTITAWVWPTGGEGKDVTPTKDGNWYVITENCIELNVIFKNGEGWNGNENQTANIEGVSENTCYQISALNKDGEGKCTYTVVDCEAAIEPEEKPAPTPTYDYYVTGSFNGWNEKDPAHGMTLDGEVYKATIALAAGENLVKVTNGTWTDAKGFSAMGAEYEEVSQGASDDNIQVDLTVGKEVVVVYNATTKKVTFKGLTEKAPAPTFDYYITGSFNGNNPKKAENGMTLDGTAYKATVTLAAGDNTLKVTDGTWDKTWGANELGAAYEEVSNPNDYNNIKITLAAEKEITVIFDATAGKITFEGLTPYVAPLTYTVTVPAGTEKCYIAGAMNGWNFQEMTATANANEFTIEIAGARETDEYKYACQADWAYAELNEDGSEKSNRTWTANDVVAKWSAPVPTTYTVAGDNAAAFGTTWDPTNAANDMVLEGDLYKWTKTNVALSANTEIKFQVVKNHDWNAGQWPGSGNDWVLNTITEDGLYTITITFKEDDKTINATANKTGEVVTKDFSNQPAILYFHPSFHWTSDYAQFAAYFYNNGPGADATPTWVNMTDANSDGIYEVDNAKQHEYVIICRMNPSRAENNWEDEVMWNQIESGITIPNTAGDPNTCLAFWKNCQGDVPTSECTWVVPTPLTDANWSTFVSTYADQTINAVVERSFKSGQFHTLCLPFNIPTNWLGDGSVAYQLTSIVANTAEHLELIASQQSTLTAGQPYIIKPVKGDEYDHIIIDNVKVQNVSAGTCVASGNGYKATLKAVATTGGQTNGTTEYYLGANDGCLYNAVVDKLGLRAVIELTTVAGQPLPARVRAYVATEENVETGFENITAPEGQTIKAIINGQLIIIRNGEMFNAQGQRL